MCRYLDNITEHPGEEKYRKIRVNNKAFSVSFILVQFYSHEDNLSQSVIGSIIWKAAK